jgi:Ca-activated chloride channel family protein
MNAFPNWYLFAGAIVLLAAAVVVLVGTRKDAHVSARTRRKRWRHLGVALALVAIAVRPTIGNVSTTTYTSGADVVLMIDRTASMGAVDYDGGKPRMDGVRADVTSLVRSLEGSRFAVIVFDNNARVALPFTTDGTAVVSLVDSLDWRTSEYGNGSDITQGLGTAQKLLARSQAADPDLSRYLFYFGDGEQTRRAAPQSFEPLRPYLAGSEVYGYGTAEGAPMLTAPGSKQYVRKDGATAISKMNEQNLNAMAQQLQGGYQHRARPGGLDVRVDHPTLIPVVHRDPRGFETYWIFGLVAAGLLIWELWDDVDYYRRARKEWR